MAYPFPDPRTELSKLYNQPGLAGDITSVASRNINNQTNRRVEDLLSRFATSGMNRTGISGVALNDIYSNAGEQLTNASVQGANADRNYRYKILAKLLGLQMFEDNKPSPWGSVLGKLLGACAQVGSAALLANANKEG